MFYLKISISDHTEISSEGEEKIELHPVIEIGFKEVTGGWYPREDTIKEIAQKAERLSVLEEKITDLVQGYYKELNKSLKTKESHQN